MQFVINHSYLIPLLPLLGAIIAGFCGDVLKDKAHLPIWICVGCSALLSLTLALGLWFSKDPSVYNQSVDFYTWISAGNFQASAGFYFDPLTAVMLSVVTGVGFIITVFSAGYMKGEEGYARFFAYLGLFIFSMTCLVMGNNLILMFLGWEGVGLCSYLLIGYYYQRPAAAAAAKKAFVVNRIGDFGFLVGIMLCFYGFGTVTFFGHHGLFESAIGALKNMPLADVGMTPDAIRELLIRQQLILKWVPFCLMLGAFGKSAQFPLYVWLPDAMEGPTPVSALIHAATMVTAGVYMIARCGTLFVSNDAALITIAAVGAFTALFAATIAMRQFDLKKVFAYSTISQLGYMFVAVGVLAPTAAIFHLLTHAFFKALLFLSSGVVMHAMLGHLDMRKMSGLKRVLPKTRIVMLIGCCALSGIPFFSGFYSKDEIIAQALSKSILLWGVLVLTALLTSYYTFRLYFRVFEGPLVQPTHPADEGHASPDDHTTVDKAAAHDDHHHDHEPLIMLAPLYILAIGALIIGSIVIRNSQLASFLGHSPSFSMAYDVAKAHFDNGGARVNPVTFGQKLESAAPAEWEFPWSLLFGAAISLTGFGAAYYLHLKERARADRLAAGLQPLTSWMDAKYKVDEFYELVLVKPLKFIGKGFFKLDCELVDGAVWAVSFVPQLSGFALKLTTQRGYLQGYAATMFFGVLAILLLVFL